MLAAEVAGLTFSMLNELPARLPLPLPQAGLAYSIYYNQTIKVFSNNADITFAWVLHHFRNASTLKLSGAFFLISNVTKQNPPHSTTLRLLPRRIAGFPNCSAWPRFN
jgi:hypothetical protein